jgi:hypothetical protein
MTERKHTPWIAASPTDERARKIATEAILLFIEYRDVHGYDEDHARIAAGQEIAEGYGTVLPGEEAEGK